MSVRVRPPAPSAFGGKSLDNLRLALRVALSETRRQHIDLTHCQKIAGKGTMNQRMERSVSEVVK